MPAKRNRFRRTGSERGDCRGNKTAAVELERNSAGELARLRSAIDKASKESKPAANDLQQQILLKDQRIAGLETRIQQLQCEIRSLKQAQESGNPI